MKIRFENTVGDAIAFYRFHFASSRSRRRQIWLFSWLLPGMLAGLFALFILGVCFLFTEPDDPPAWAFGLCSVVPFLALSGFWILFIHLFRRFVVRTARKVLTEEPNRIMFGWREMEVVGGRLIVSSELLQSSLDLRAIHKIVSTGKYTFVYFAARDAYIIPLRFVPEPDYRQFIADLRDAWENSETAVPVDGD
jgi:hypothetical protein